MRLPETQEEKAENKIRGHGNSTDVTGIKASPFSKQGRWAVPGLVHADPKCQETGASAMPTDGMPPPPPQN